MAKETKASLDSKQEPTGETMLTLADVQAQIAAMLAEAKAEADRIIKEAHAATGKGVSMERAAELAADKERGEELVRVKLFKDTGKYKDDVFVSVNGEAIAIKRGEVVEIKRKFAEVLDNSEHQDYETAQLIERKSGEWAAKSAALEN